jgi:predicted nuclease of restriction endonuclease-like (RecB) superfamily
MKPKPYIQAGQSGNLHWFRIDLIFFHRRPRGLVIADLKVGKFSYADDRPCH